MKRTMKSLCILTAFLTFAINTFSLDLMAIPIALYRSFPINKPLGPNRAPTKSSLPVEVYMDESAPSLIFSNGSECEVTYYIHNEQEELKSQGICLFDANRHYAVSLAGLSTGAYTLYVVINGVQYQGTFEIEN